MLPNLTDSLPIIRERTRYEQPFPLDLSIPHFDNSLRHTLTKLKDFMNEYIINKEIFDLQQRHAIESLTSNKNFFSSHIVNIFHVYFFHNFSNNNNVSPLLILQTQTYQDNSSKLDIT